MGHSREATCKSCGHQFEAMHGGGMAFELLRCTRCGKTKEVAFMDLYKEPDYSPSSQRERNDCLERYAGSCSCGGKYKKNGRIRCPKCKSLDIAEGRITVDYD